MSFVFNIKICICSSANIILYTLMQYTVLYCSSTLYCTAAVHCTDLEKTNSMNSADFNYLKHFPQFFLQIIFLFIFVTQCVKNNIYIYISRICCEYYSNLYLFISKHYSLHSGSVLLQYTILYCISTLHRLGKNELHELR